MMWPNYKEETRFIPPITPLDPLEITHKMTFDTDKENEKVGSPARDID
jgi:hypothetical protein